MPHVWWCGVCGTEFQTPYGQDPLLLNKPHKLSKPIAFCSGCENTVLEAIQKLKVIKAEL